MNIQELAKKHTFEVLETLKIAEEIFKKKNLTPTTDVSFSEERAIEVAITEYRKNTPKIGKLRKKSDKKIPETIKPKLQPSTSFNLEKTTLKEVEEVYSCIIRSSYFFFYSFFYWKVDLLASSEAVIFSLVVSSIFGGESAPKINIWNSCFFSSVCCFFGF